MITCPKKPLVVRTGAQLREDLQALSGQIRRIDHPAMISNGLTRIKGSNEALYRLIRSGGFSIQAEKYQMEIREAALKKGISQSQIRRIGIKEKGCMTTIDPSSTTVGVSCSDPRIIPTAAPSQWLVQPPKGKRRERCIH